MTAISGTAFVVATILKTVVFFTLLMVFVALSTYMERKVAGFLQDRSGPNRVGPLGLLQVMADGLKFILKEELAPSGANRRLFYLAPVLALVPATVLFAVIPFGAPIPTPWGIVELIVADVPVGFLYVLAIGSLGVYGIVMAGWSSNSKYSFLGGLRGSAQMISYEIALGMSLVPVLLLAGNVRMPELVSMQQTFADGPATYGLWFVLPLLFGSFTFFVSGMAETNRAPFDMPEAEAELVGGFHTEYSAMKFGMFFLGEYAHMVTLCALFTVFFLGGWDIPFWTGDDIRILADGTVIGNPAWWKTLLTLVAFTMKGALVLFVVMWIRWTIPRFRYDQLMDLGWKVMIPVLMVYIMVVAITIYILETLGIGTGLVAGAVLTGVNFVLVLGFVFGLDRGVVIRGGSGSTPGPMRTRAVSAITGKGD
jgi:NADH-quinone oxidoreductase subunit H